MRFRAFLLFACVSWAAFAWDVEHDEIAQLTGEFLPAEIKRVFDFDDFSILLSNCHYPDMTEWPVREGRRQYRSLSEIAEKVGLEDAAILKEQGYRNSGWLHREHARALVLGLLARAFARNEHAKAAFYISIMTHQVSDESALNHPPLLQFAQYARFPGVDLCLRKVEEGAKNVFGFRSDGYVMHRARQLLAGHVPVTPTNDFAAAVMDLVVDSVRQADAAARQEGVIGFGPRHAAEEALAALVAMQIRVIQNMIWTAWTFRSPTAALPDRDFSARCQTRQLQVQRTLDPAKQAVFAGIFETTGDPPNPKAVVGLVCEPYGMFSLSETPYMGRMIVASCGRTLRQNGYAVRGISHYAVEREGLPDPKDVPLVILCTGGTGYTCSDIGTRIAAQAIDYRERGGRLVLVGGTDTRNISGFAEALRKRPDADMPVSAHGAADGKVPEMSIVGEPGLGRLGGSCTRFVRSPNIVGFCRAVCALEAAKTGAGTVPLFSLDNGRETFAIAVRKGRVTWLPMYLLAQYLLVEGDPHLDLGEMTLDPYGEKVLLDVLEAAWR